LGFPTDIQFSGSTLSTEPVLDWSDVGKFKSNTSLGPDFDATPLVIWSQNISPNRSSIRVGYPNEEINPPSLLASTLANLNANLAQDPGPMIASNDKAGIIMAIWLEQS